VISGVLPRTGETRSPFGEAPEYKGVSRKPLACCASTGRAPRCVVVLAHSSAMGSSSALRSPTRLPIPPSCGRSRRQRSTGHTLGDLRQDLGGDQLQVVEVVQVENLEVDPASAGGGELAQLVHDLRG